MIFCHTSFAYLLEYTLIFIQIFCKDLSLVYKISRWFSVILLEPYVRCVPYLFISSGHALLVTVQSDNMDEMQRDVQIPLAAREYYLQQEQTEYNSGGRLVT